MQFSMRRMIIFMGRLVFCNTGVIRYVKGIYLPRYFMFQSMKEEENRIVQNKPVKTIKFSSWVFSLYQIVSISSKM